MNRIDESSDSFFLINLIKKLGRGGGGIRRKYLIKFAGKMGR